MLRKKALNPDSKQKKGENDNETDLAKKSNLMSKFAVISDNEEDEHSEASDSGSDYD